MSVTKIIEVDGTTFTTEIFERVEDLLATKDERTEKFSDGAKHNSSWVGASYRDAFDMLEFGWNKRIDDVITEVNALSKKHDKIARMKVKNDVVGFAPHIPNLLAGVPETMINGRLEIKKSKVITIVYDSGVSSGITTYQVLNYSKKVMAYIMQLEKQGFRVRLYVLNNYSNRSKSFSMLLKLKSEYQPLDIKRLVFPMCHTAYQRAVGFDWYEKFPQSEEFSGYGRPMYIEYNREKIEKYITKLVGKNANFLRYQDDIEKLIKKGGK